MWRLASRLFAWLSRSESRAAFQAITSRWEKIVGSLDQRLEKALQRIDKLERELQTVRNAHARCLRREIRSARRISALVSRLEALEKQAESGQADDAAGEGG